MRPTGIVMVAGLLLATAFAAGGDEPDAPLIATVGETRITESEKDDLGGRVLGLLLEKYAAERKITVTDEEVAKFLASMQEGIRKEQARVAARIAELESSLESGELAEDERAKVSEELGLLKDLPDGSTEEELSDAEKKELAGMREGMARAVVQAWKVNQALFDRYGGRVIYQQGGPEPLDAYRQFLEERLKAGAFVLADPKYEAALWRIYRNDELHDFVPEDRRAELIRTPPWERIASGE